MLAHALPHRALRARPALRTPHKYQQAVDSQCLYKFCKDRPAADLRSLYRLCKDLLAFLILRLSSRSKHYQSLQKSYEDKPAADFRIQILYEFYKGQSAAADFQSLRKCRGMRFVHPAGSPRLS